MAAQVLGLPIQTFAAWLRGAYNFDGPEEAKIRGKVLRLVEVVDALAPLSIKPESWYTLKSLVDSGMSANEIRETVATLFPQQDEVHGRVFENDVTVG